VRLRSCPRGFPPSRRARWSAPALRHFNALRNSGAQPGDTVAISAASAAWATGRAICSEDGLPERSPIARGNDKEALARKLGAHQYIDSQAQDVAAELNKAGGAKVVLCDSDQRRSDGCNLWGVSQCMESCSSWERLTIPSKVPVLLLIGGRRSIMGWYSGTAIDFSGYARVQFAYGLAAMTEVYPLERAAEAYERMMSGKARFRVVLTTKP